MKNAVQICSALVFVSLLCIIVSCGDKQAEDTAPIKRPARGNQSAMQIEVLTIPGCQVTPPTVDLVKTTADEMGTSYEITIVTVENHQQANDLRFIGSPTVRINGVDIDPGSHLKKHYGVT
jgi:hypothetical protein